MHILIYIYTQPKQVEKIDLRRRMTAARRKRTWLICLLSWKTKCRYVCRLTEWHSYGVTVFVFI